MADELVIREQHPKVRAALVNAEPVSLKRYLCGSPLVGEIKPGQVMLWEPLLPHAVQLVVVTKVIDERVWCRDIDSAREYRNDESRFREACIRTIFKDHPIEFTTGPVVWPWTELEAACDRVAAKPPEPKR